MTDSHQVRLPREHLTNIDIAKILRLAKVELSHHEIALLMHCSQKAVQHTLTSYTFETFQGQHPRREYPQKTTEREDQYIECALRQNSFLPLRDITNIIEPKILYTTLWRWRSEAGLGSYIAAEKPGLSKEQLASRLQWAVWYKDWTVDDWKKVIWSDESSMWIGVNPRHQWVIHPPGERLNPKYVKRTFKGAHVKIMVWACFTGERLIVCEEGGVGADEYEEIIYDSLFLLIDNLLQPPEMANTI